jgi:hypothetical protein
LLGAGDRRARERHARDDSEPFAVLVVPIPKPASACQEEEHAKRALLRAYKVRFIGFPSGTGVRVPTNLDGLKGAPGGRKVTQASEVNSHRRREILPGFRQQDRASVAIKESIRERHHTGLTIGFERQG